MYADTDLWLALLKEEDWLADRARSHLHEYAGDLRVSLATFVELFLVEDRYGFDRDVAVACILALARYEGDEDAVFQASAYVDDGLNALDAFHAALAGDVILSSDRAFDTISVERVPLEPDRGS